MGLNKLKDIQIEKTKNLEKIFGRVIEKRETIMGIFKENTTFYTLFNEDESCHPKNKNVYCSFRGHYRDSPKKGDLIEVHLTDESCGIGTWAKRNKAEDGYFEFEEGTINYREIKRYKILESS